VTTVSLFVVVYFYSDVYVADANNAKWRIN